MKWSLYVIDWIQKGACRRVYSPKEGSVRTSPPGSLTACSLTDSLQVVTPMAEGGKWTRKLMRHTWFYYKITSRASIGFSFHPDGTPWRPFTLIAYVVLGCRWSVKLLVLILWMRAIKRIVNDIGLLSESIDHKINWSREASLFGQCLMWCTYHKPHRNKGRIKQARGLCFHNSCWAEIL